MYQTIIGLDALQNNIDRSNWLVIDCRYDLGDKTAGYQTYLESHIVGAIYADISEDLSGEAVTDSGRHPLPTANKLRRVFSTFGINRNSQVVVYDASAGAFAARLWWLLRYMGHEAVAVLDGGWQAWQSSNLQLETGKRCNSPESFEGEVKSEWLVTLEHVEEAPLLVDSRDPERYRGEVEPIDPVAGHIPGALNYCWKENLAENGQFLDSEQLRQQLGHVYTDTPANEVVFYCGSGVTACHNLLAVAHSGLPAARLYAGSWSEWCNQENPSVSVGANPG